MLASALGGAVCLAIMFSSIFSVFPEGASDEGMAIQAAFGAMMGAGLGVSLGIAQWIVLHGQVARAGWWVLISLVGVALSMAVSIPLSGEGREFLSLSVGGLVAGALTGLPMLWLLRQSRP